MKVGREKGREQEDPGLQAFTDQQRRKSLQRTVKNRGQKAGGSLQVSLEGGRRVVRRDGERWWCCR